MNLMKEEQYVSLDDLENFAKKISKKIVHKNILLSTFFYFKINFINYIFFFVSK